MSENKNKMNPEVKDLWIERLRSGKDQKGKGKLNDGQGNLCCLGVLCEVAIEQGVVLEVTNSDGWVAYDWDTATLPESVRTWAGLDGDNPVLVEEWGQSIGRTIAEVNDYTDRTLVEMADVVEAEL